MTAAASPALREDFLDRIDQQLGDTDTFLARCYPGEDARRQPVHTVYVPADRYSADLPWQWGNAAMALVDQHGGIEALCTDLVSDLSFCGWTTRTWSSTPPTGRTGSSRPPAAGRAPRRATKPGWELLVSAEPEVGG